MLGLGDGSFLHAPDRHGRRLVAGQRRRTRITEVVQAADCNQTQLLRRRQTLTDQESIMSLLSARRQAETGPYRLGRSESPRHTPASLCAIGWPAIFSSTIERTR